MNVNVNLSLILSVGTVAQKVKGSEFTLHTEFMFWDAKSDRVFSPRVFANAFF